MRILVYGAGVLGCNLARNLFRFGKDVTLLARGNWAEEIKDLMVDVLCGERSVVSEGKRVSEETAKSAYRKITFDHVQYVMKSLVSYPDKISRIDRFLTASLFNSVYTLTNSTFAGFEHDMQMKML